MEPTFDAEAELRRHAGALRSLASSLVRDAHAADDIVQDAWVRAAEAPPRHGASPRGWLATIVHRLARRWQRSERRRRVREQLAVEAAATRDADGRGTAEREELLQRLVDAVRALPQPYRDAIWQRYFEDLAPADIAARSGVPLATVKSRLQRGLAQLRARLDGDGGRDGGWRRGLVAAFGLRPEAAAVASAGITVMTTKAKVVVVSAVLTLALLGAFAVRPRPASLDAPSGDAPAVARGAVGAAAPHAPRSAEDATAARVPVVDNPPPGTGALLVRALRPDGTPATNETLVVRRHREGGSFHARAVRTDDAGTARFDELPPMTVAVRLLQHTEESNAQVRAGAVTELELLLPAGIELHGRVVDADRRPIAGAEVDLMEFNSSLAAAVATADADGRFLVRHVAPTSMVSARTARHAAAPWQLVQGTSGGRADVVVTLIDAGGVVDGIVVRADGRAVAGAEVLVGRSSFDGVVTSTGLPATAVPVRAADDGRFRIVGLAQGENPVVVRAAGFAPWRGTCAVFSHATSTLRVEMSEGVTCTGVARDAAGTPAAGGLVRPRGFDGASWCWTEVAADGSFTLAGLPPGPIELRAEHDEMGRGGIRVAGDAGAVVPCELVLSRGIELRGRAVDPAGAAVAGVLVFARSGDRTAPQSEQGRSDAEGRFVVTNCPEGLLTVIAYRGNDEVRVERVDPRTGDLELRLPSVAVALPASVRIRGSLVDPEGRPIEGAEVSAYTPRTERRVECATAADGTFELGPVPPGTWTLYVPAQRFVDHRSGPRELAADATWDLGRITLLAGGTATVTVHGAPADVRPSFSITDRTRRGFGGHWIADRVLRSLALAPGEYTVQVRCDGLARAVVPFAVRAGEDVSVAVRLEPGVRQRVELVRTDGAKVSNGVSHSLAAGEIVLIDRYLLCDARRADHAADGALVCNLWLAPGAYRLDVQDRDATARAEFTVGEREGAPLRLVLR
jgi:RNA polymerase sigma factor (sigma-70 family)